MSSSHYKNMNSHQRRELQNLTTREQQYMYMLMLETGELNITYIPTPLWIKQLGQDLNQFVKDGKIKKIWFDSEEVIHVE